MNWWLFPPRTEEVQFDEKWSFVYQKEARCRPGSLPDRHRGDNWDHVALDAEHRLVLEVVPGKRRRQQVRRLVQAVRARTGGRILRLFTSDEYKPYGEELLTAYGVAEAVERTGRPGRPRKPRLVPPPGLLYATVHKTRRKGRVVKVQPRLVFGSRELLERALRASRASRAVNISFVERQNATDRQRNGRKVRKSYRFSKDWEVHNAGTYFSLYSYNFCWPVRTLREELAPGVFRERTPAMAAGLTDHVWSLREWLTYPARTDKAC